MFKETSYFSHDTNAKDDVKCVQLIEQLGLEGYGIFWILIETLRDQPDFKYPLNLLGALARRYLSSREKFEAVVLNYDLFQVAENEFFYSESLNKRMRLISEKHKKRALAGRKGGNAKAMLKQCSGNAVAIPSKEKKEKEKKEKESKRKKKHPFEESPLFDKTKFRERFSDWPDWKLKKYYVSAVAYSGANGGRYLDWGLAIQNWARKDEDVNGTPRISKNIIPGRDRVVL